MKKHALVAAICFVLLLPLTTCGKKSSEEIKPTLENVSLDCNNVETYLLKDSSLKLDKAFIKLSYSDLSIVTEEITNYLVGEPSYEYGVNHIDIDYVLNEENYYFSIEYCVFENNSELEITKKIHSLPYINNLSINDVESVSEISKAYSNLSSADKEFLNTYFESAVDRLEKTEMKLIEQYHQTKTDELNEYYRCLNQSSYDLTNLNNIQQKILEFANGDYSSLENLIQEYESAVEYINSVEKKDVSIEDYKESTINYLNDKFKVDFYKVVPQLDQFSFAKQTKNYLEIESISQIFNSVKSQISESISETDVDNAFSSGFAQLENAFIPLFIEDAVYSVREIFESVKNIEKDLLDSWDDISISVSGLFDNILVDYLDDNRWWIPDVYKPKTILDASRSEFEKYNSVEGLVSIYNEFIYEITRATLQKNLEMYYSIWRNRNPVYDKTDTYYWNILADYWGDTPERQFVYNGPLSEYVGTTYGNSSSNGFRLVGFFFSDSYRVLTPEALLTKYFELKTHIAPPPLAVEGVEVNLSDMKTEYLLNESVDLTGGVAVVSYNDSSTADVNLTNSMIVGSIDTSTVGSKLVNIKFNDPKLNLEQEASFYIVVLSENEKYNQIISKISELPEITKVSDDDVDRVEEILALLDNLSESELEYFISTFSTEYNKFRSYEMSCASYYGKQSLNPVYISYEKLNIKAYSNSDQADIKSAFNEMVSNVKSHTSFKQIDEDIASFNSVLSSKELDTSVSLNDFKSLTISSIDELCEYQVNQYSGEKNNISYEYVTQSLKDNENVKPLYDSLCGLITSADSVESIVSIYSNGIDELYTQVITSYKEVANANLRQSMFDLRSTISMLWEIDGNDIVELTGEAGSKMTTDYLDDSGYYIWYVPAPYRTGNLYSKIKVDMACTNKQTIRESYDFALFDISRATMYRNIICTWAYKGLQGPWWGIIAYSPALPYDGAIPEYEGLVFGDSQYRLWGWGYRYNQKANSIAELVEKYNYDLGLFL